MSPAARQWVTGSQLMGHPGLRCQSCGMARTFRGCRGWGLKKGHQQLRGQRDGEDEAWRHPAPILPLPPARHVPLNTCAVISSPPDTSPSTQPRPQSPSQPTHVHTHVHVSPYKACLHGRKGQMPPRSLFLSCSTLLHLIPPPRICWQAPDQWPGSHAPWKVRISPAQAILVLQGPTCPLCPTPSPSHTQHCLASSGGYLETGPPPLHPLPAVLSWHTPMLPGLRQTSRDWSRPRKPRWTELLGSKMQKMHIREVSSSPGQ